MFSSLEAVRPAGGAGRGKDMANIIQAQRKQEEEKRRKEKEREREAGETAAVEADPDKQASCDSSMSEGEERKVGQPPTLTGTT